jgi:TATA-box binding protein (TBP) (component of TFIID and TFIIIB)
MENSKVSNTSIRAGELNHKKQKVETKSEAYINFTQLCHLDGKEYNFTNLPNELNISTMTIVCKTNIIFNVKNIGEKLELNDTIIYIRYNKTERASIERPKKRKIKLHKEKKNFYNQVSIAVKIDDTKKINIKLFINGSIQITGCKSLEHVLIGVSNLFNQIKNSIYVDDTNKLIINNLFDVKIAMINSNFDIGFHIDRDKLFYLMKNKTKYVCMYDANYHACVDIKYEEEDKIISIFVFESGSIVITGSRNCLHIINAYNFIYEFLIENYRDVVQNKLFRGVSILNFFDE